MSLSQHDALHAIQSKLDDRDGRWHSQLTTSTAELREIRDAVADLSSIATGISHVTSTVEKLDAGQLLKERRGSALSLPMTNCRSRISTTPGSSASSAVSRAAQGPSASPDGGRRTVDHRDNEVRRLARRTQAPGQYHMVQRPTWSRQDIPGVSFAHCSSPAGAEAG
jgi:hypothetical protein